MAVRAIRSRVSRRDITVSRQDHVVDLIDQAILVGCLLRQYRKFRSELPQEVAVFDEWDRLFTPYLAGLRTLREQAIAEVWPDR